MRTQTKYFGEIEYDDDDVLHFASGLFGFEEERQFLLLPFEGQQGMLLCLQSLQTPQLAFMVMDPFLLKPGYTPVLQPGELRTMGADTSAELCYYVLCVVRRPVQDSTVNLQCPIVIHADTRRAAQVILESPEYGMRHCLSEFGTKEADGPC